MKEFARKNPLVIAVIITILASLMIVFTSSIRILLTDDVTTLEVLLYMNVVTGFFFFLFVKTKKLPMKVVNKPMVLARAVLGFIGVYAFFYAYEVGLSLSAGIFISKLVPIFSVLGSILFLKEVVVGKEKVMLPVSLFVAIIGVIIVANPLEQGTGGVVPVLIGVIASMGSGLALVAIRKAIRTDKPEVISFFNSVFVVVVGFAILIFSGQFRLLSLANYGYLILTGFFNTFAVFGLALATVFASPTKTAPYSYTSVIFAPIVQLILFGTIISWNVLVGGLLIVGINLVNFAIAIQHKNNTKEKKNYEKTTNTSSNA